MKYMQAWRCFRDRACFTTLEWLTAHNFQQPLHSAPLEETRNCLPDARVCLGCASAVEWVQETHYFRRAVWGIGSSVQSARLSRANKSHEATIAPRRRAREDRSAIPVFFFEMQPHGRVDVVFRSEPISFVVAQSFFGYLHWRVPRPEWEFTWRDWWTRKRSPHARHKRALVTGLECALEFMHRDSRGTHCKMFAIAHPLTFYIL